MRSRPLRGSVRVAVLLCLICSCQEYTLEEHPITDVFVQGSDEETVVDVLWVIDNSGTMAEEQQRLTESLTEVAPLFGETLADFRLGVITTDVDDPDQSGKLQGSPLVIGPESDDITGEFLSNTDVGIAGSKDEQGFEAIRLALVNDDGSNSGFFRAETGLHAVVVSDEDDHSDSTVSERMSDLLRLVPDSTNFKIHAVVGDEPDGCLSAVAAADSGARYLDAARHTEGYSGSICLEDWTPLLSSIVRESLGLLDTFVLSREPDPTTLEVRVDEVGMPQREEDGWTHDLGLNAVVFHGNAIPRAGMEVVVSYYILR